MSKAPDKIYAYIPDGDSVGTCSVEREVPHSCVTNEYIRKDALLQDIEKTYERRERLKPEECNGEDYEAGFIDGFDRFRSYIKSIILSL